MRIFYTYLSNPPQQFESEAASIIVGRTWRDQPVDLDLTPDNTVSRRHARLSQAKGVLWLEDLGSTGGTWINGQRITTKTRLSPGDIVTVGQTTFEVMAETAPLIAAERTPEGVLTSSVSAADSPSALILAAASQEIIKRRLTAFYELGAALGTADTVESLSQTVVQHLRQAIPRARRAALLLHNNEHGLTPTAYVPENAKPSISLNLARRAIERQQAFTWRLPTVEETGGPFDSVILHGTQCAMYAPLIWKEEVLGIVFVDNTDIGGNFDDEDLRLLMAMASQAAMFVKNYALQQDLRHQEVVRSNLMRQFSPQVAERLERMLSEPGDWQLGGKRAEPVTILVSDVRGFTTLTAGMDPGDVVELLNELFSVCIPIIFKYNGAVDKYVGDAILAVFGSPEPDHRQWEHAVQAALEMQQAINTQQSAWQSRSLPVCQVGIGIHTGAVLHGFIGVAERMEYTVIGETVNRAVRYCDGAERGEVIISPEVYQRVADLVEAVPRTIRTKHPETEPDMPAYVVQALKFKSTAPLPAVE
ncbi:MAG: FHA domain-containing protein [Anaerolineales bacterium]|nr:FHA domain-containing protein [Anaerolineales bacterium]